MEYMQNQMDNLIEAGIARQEEFNCWLFEVCEFKSSKLKDAHDILPYINLQDAKLSFLDGISAKEYSTTINL